MVKNPSANTGNVNSVPGPGRFHMPRGTALTEPTHLEPVFHKERSHLNEQPAHLN